MTKTDILRCVDCGTQDKGIYEIRCFRCDCAHKAEIPAGSEGWSELIATMTKEDSK